MSAPFDSVLLIAFGGPTRPEEIRPFLADLTRGRPIPPERIEAVLHHYELIGGRSPLNQLTLRQAQALQAALRSDGPAFPVFVGMRNWHPYVRDTIAAMQRAGHRRAVGIILSAQQTDASWERYRDTVTEARSALGAGAPEVVIAAPWSDHPLFIEAVADGAAAALRQLPVAEQAAAHLIFTAHSVPVAMAQGSPYIRQIETGARAVADRLGHTAWSIAYQSRTGNPRDPWLEPDISDALKALAARGTGVVVVIPIGFVCDHVEVLYDLDIEAKGVADQLGMTLVRARTVNDHPTFIRMLADVVRRTMASADT